MSDKPQVVKTGEGPDWLVGFSWQYGSRILHELGISSPLYDLLPPVSFFPRHRGDHRGMTWIRIILHLTDGVGRTFGPDSGHMIQVIDFDKHFHSSHLVTFALADVFGFEWCYYVRGNEVYLEGGVREELQDLGEYLRATAKKLRSTTELWHQDEALCEAIKAKSDIFRQVCGEEADIVVVRDSCLPFDDVQSYFGSSDRLAGTQAVQISLGENRGLAGSLRFVCYAQPKGQGAVYDLRYVDDGYFRRLEDGQVGSVDQLVTKVAGSIASQKAMEDQKKRRKK